jgi:hypothetical protein
MKLPLFSYSQSHSHPNIKRLLTHRQCLSLIFFSCKGDEVPLVLTSQYNDAAPGWQTGPRISGNQSESCKSTHLSEVTGDVKKLFYEGLFMTFLNLSVDTDFCRMHIRIFSGLSHMYRRYLPQTRMPTIRNKTLRIRRRSVKDPDPHVFGPPESAFVSQRYGSGTFFTQNLSFEQYIKD